MKNWIRDRWLWVQIFCRHGFVGARNVLLRWIADHLPLKVVYFTVIRAWANATTGQWSGKDATKVTADELCNRLDIDWRP